MTVLRQHREDLLHRAGVMLARGLPWEVVWRFPLEDQATVEESFLGELAASRRAAEGGEG